MELREKVVAALLECDFRDGEEGAYQEAADAILSIPEIAEALEAARHWSEGVELPPELIKKMGAVYGSERKIRVTDD